MDGIGVWQRLDIIARALCPSATLFLLVLASLLPLRSPTLAPVMPSLMLVGVYHWSIFRPDLLPAWAVLCLGLFHDLLFGLPLGSGALVLLLVQRTIHLQRKLFQNATLAILWAIFAGMAALAMGLQWILVAVLAGTLGSGDQMLLQYAVTLASYPVVAWLLLRTQQFLLS